MPTIAVTIVDQTVGVTQVGEIGPTGATGPTGTVSAAGDGTAAAPGIAFASDTDTGFWRPGTNAVAASTGGLERLRINSAGAVGIGTSSPAAVSIPATDRGLSSAAIRAEKTVGGGNTLEMTSNFVDGNTVGLNPYVSGVSNGGFELTLAGTQRFVIASGGNVGIGTTSPGEKLDVVGNIKVQNGTGFTTANSIISKVTSYAGSANQFENASINFLTGAFSDGGQISFTTASGGVRSEAVRIATSGDVGIGTNSPSVIAGYKALTLNNTTGSFADFREAEVNRLRLGGDGGSGFVNGVTGVLRLMTSDTLRVNIDGSGHVTPGADNTQNFGSGSLRWATIYAGTGTINTSDERYKVLREGGDLSDAEYRAWSNVRAIVYQDKDSFERKGSAARLHVGYSWQSIQAAFEAEGLDAARYGLWCEDALEAPVEKTRMVSRPVEGQTETIPVLDDDGKLVFEQIQETEEVEQPFEEVRMIDGAPVLVKGVRTVAQPVFDSVQIRDEDGKLLFDTPQPVEDPETGELVEGDPLPRTAPVPRMISKAKTETVPVMEEVEETFTEMEPTGETRGALRYNQCSVIEAAWLRRELAALTARLSALEAA